MRDSISASDSGPWALVNVLRTTITAKYQAKPWPNSSPLQAHKAPMAVARSTSTRRWLTSASQPQPAGPKMRITCIIDINTPICDALMP